MSVGERYEYRGDLYSLSELSRKANLHRDTILRRLRDGWSVESIVEFGQEATQARLLTQLHNGDIVPVVFHAGVPVLQSMQPTIGRTYTATACGISEKTSRMSKPFFLIQLENGKKLITYPGEFEILALPDTDAS